MAHKQIYYSDKYDDDKYEYRLVKSRKNEERKFRLRDIAWIFSHSFLWLTGM